ncbi:hypothetical protein [Flammeovirga aprica]|uniref:Dipeptidylpeptidase IV N-terminal domain-containing protein n=1 Tax=Flammeovirga aprica JL-4 TaxID=694437 RepID=A0A7X9P332_9BACT|nr:hypothetical protein [Flammeovirga aprica]NME68107.1 hypothetical protein [Flammeovirga aprica JL-4]
MLRKFIIIAVAILQYSCLSTDRVYLTQEELDQHFKTIADAKFKPKNVAVAVDHSIYFYDQIDQPPHIITEETSTKKRLVKVSQDNTKFAYLNDDNLIEVIDRDGKLITTLEEYQNVQSFDWTEGGKTLYILNDGEVSFYGNTSIIVPEFVYPEESFKFFNPKAVDVRISSENDFAVLVSHSYYDTRTRESKSVFLYKSNGEALSIMQYNYATNIAFTPDNFLKVYKYDFTKNIIDFPYTIETFDRNMQRKEFLKSMYEMPFYLGPIFTRGEVYYTYLGKGNEEDDFQYFVLKTTDYGDEIETYNTLTSEGYEYISMDSKWTDDSF